MSAFAGGAMVFAALLFGALTIDQAARGLSPGRVVWTLLWCSITGGAGLALMVAR